MDTHASQQGQDRADAIVAAQRQRRPSWRNVASKPAPGWFSGGELDYLDARERRELHRETLAKLGPAPWFVVALPAVWLPQFIEGLHSERRTFWMTMAALYVLAGVSGLVTRRVRLLRAARRSVRERADWPLRSGHASAVLE